MRKTQSKERKVKNFSINFNSKKFWYRHAKKYVAAPYSLTFEKIVVQFRTYFTKLHSKIGAVLSEWEFSLFIFTEV